MMATASDLPDMHRAFEQYEASEMARRTEIIMGSHALHKALWREHPRTMRRLFENGRAEAPQRLVIVRAPALAAEEPAPPPPVRVIPSARVSVAPLLIDRVSEALGISHGELIGEGRSYRFVMARAVVARVLRDRGWATTQIGRALRRDHSTVINLLKRWPHWSAMSAEAAAAYEAERGE